MMRDAGLMIKNESGSQKRWMVGLGIYDTQVSLRPNMLEIPVEICKFYFKFSLC